MKTSCLEMLRSRNSLVLSAQSQQRAARDRDRAESGVQKGLREVFSNWGRNWLAAERREENGPSGQGKRFLCKPVSPSAT